jgi:hypothetical protein
MNDKAPNAVSYAALLLVINNRLHLHRSVQEQRYFIDLANDLIRLYWAYEADSSGESEQRRKAA